MFKDFSDDFMKRGDGETLGALIIESLEEDLPNMGKIPCFKFDNDGKIDIQSSLFNNNKHALNWLLKFISDKVPNWNLFLQDNDYEIDFGLKYYICHYITLIFYCLFENNNNNPQSELFVETEMKGHENTFAKADIEPFYKVIQQFGVYNACFPHQERSEETFYLKLFNKCMCIISIVFSFFVDCYYLRILQEKFCLVLNKK